MLIKSGMGHAVLTDEQIDGAIARHIRNLFRGIITEDACRTMCMASLMTAHATILPDVPFNSVEYGKIVEGRLV